MPFLNTGDLNKIMDALMSREATQCLVAQSLIAKAKDGLAEPALREAAHAKYGSDDVEIDDEPGTAPADGGTWVAAWVWIEEADNEEEAETCKHCGEERGGFDEGSLWKCGHCNGLNEGEG